MFDLDLNAYLCKDIGRNIYKIKEEDMNILMESITGGTELAVLVNIIDVIYIKKSSHAQFDEHDGTYIKYIPRIMHDSIWYRVIGIYGTMHVSSLLIFFQEKNI